MKQDLAAIEALVSRETIERLRSFEAELRRWTLRINLIAKADIEHIWARHILDSLQILPLIPTAATDGVDLGAGAGFPGMVLAIARPALRMTLVESDHRKAAFLQHIAAELGVAVRVIAARIEALSLPPVDFVTARALAPLDRLLELAAPWLGPEGFCLFPKGRQGETELTAASARWQMRVSREASRTDPDAVIFRLDGISRVT
ncbi:MAG: 16S rRNA (guanine(527)-N(7))-methyltransferase RsmG [Acidiphilium sp.]